MRGIYYWNSKTGVQLRTLRKLEKAGRLLVDSSPGDIVYAIRANLRKGNTLTAVQQLHLLRHRKDLKRLLPWAEDLEIMLSNLGNVSAEAAAWVPIGVSVSLAAFKSDYGITNIVNWLRPLLNDFPAGKCCHHAYIAVRLLWNVPEEHFDHVQSKMVSGLRQCRRRGPLEGYYSTDKNGRTIYHRKVEKVLDL